MKNKPKIINTKQVAGLSTTPDISMLIVDLRGMIDETRSTVAVAVNVELTLLYWRIGQRIHKDILGHKRASYGDEIVSTLSRHLSEEYGNSFSTKNLRHMIKFTESFPDIEIVSTLSRQLLRPCNNNLLSSSSLYLFNQAPHYLPPSALFPISIDL